jgi:hypothetical protein
LDLCLELRLLGELLRLAIIRCRGLSPAAFIHSMLMGFLRITIMRICVSPIGVARLADVLLWRGGIFVSHPPSAELFRGPTLVTFRRARLLARVRDDLDLLNAARLWRRD